MTAEELLRLSKEVMEDARNVMIRKNADYTGGSDTQDCFKNFRLGEVMGIGSTSQGIRFRLADKLARLNTFANKGKFEVTDESLRDTTIDAINYLLINYALEIENRKTHKDDEILFIPPITKLSIDGFPLDQSQISLNSIWKNPEFTSPVMVVGLESDEKKMASVELKPQGKPPFKLDVTTFLQSYKEVK